MNDQIPSIFIVPKKEIEKQPIQETNETTVPIHSVPSIFVSSNGVNIDMYIKTVKKDIKELEELRRNKHSKKNYSKITTKISELSNKISADLEDIVAQTPTGIRVEQIYTMPEKVELDNLLRTRKEHFSEIMHLTLGGFIGGLISATLGLIPYSFISDPKMVNHIDKTLEALSLLIPPITGFIGTYNVGKFVRIQAAHLEPLNTISEKRRDQAIIYLNFINESYNKGTVDNRVEMRVKEIIETGSDISSAIITYNQRATDYNSTYYEALISSRIVNQLGRFVTDTKNKARVIENIPELIKLEKKVGISHTPIEYETVFVEAETLFVEAIKSREFKTMQTIAYAIRDIADSNYDTLGISPTKDQNIRDLRDKWQNAAYDCNDLLHLNKKLEKTTIDAKKQLIRDKIAYKFTKIKIPHYEKNKELLN